MIIKQKHTYHSTDVRFRNDTMCPSKCAHSLATEEPAKHWPQSLFIYNISISIEQPNGELWVWRLAQQQRQLAHIHWHHWTHVNTIKMDDFRLRILIYSDKNRCTRAQLERGEWEREEERGRGEKRLRSQVVGESAKTIRCASTIPSLHTTERLA